MDSQADTRTTPHGRMLIVRRLAEGQWVIAVAVAMGVTAKTVRRWRDRFDAEGAQGLRRDAAAVPPRTTFAYRFATMSRGCGCAT